MKSIAGSNTKKTIERKIVASLHFLPFLENKKLSDISTLDIKNYQAERKLEILNDPKNSEKKESEINFRSINIEKATLSHFFNFCIEHGYVQNNPAIRIKKLNELKRIKTLDDEDIKKLIDSTHNKLTKDLISFLIYSGCRKGEALNLKWDDVDLKNDVIAIKGTKTKDDRYIPISKLLKELLSGIDKKSEYVFTGINGKV